MRARGRVYMVALTWSLLWRRSLVSHSAVSRVVFRRSSPRFRSARSRSWGVRRYGVNSSCGTPRCGESTPPAIRDSHRCDVTVSIGVFTSPWSTYSRSGALFIEPPEVLGGGTVAGLCRSRHRLPSRSRRARSAGRPPHRPRVRTGRIPFGGAVGVLGDPVDRVPAGAVDRLPRPEITLCSGDHFSFVADWSPVGAFRSTALAMLVIVSGAK